MTESLDIFVQVMFHGDLRELPDGKSPLELSFTGTRSLNDLIQSLRVPHTEVGKALVDNEPADLNYNVKNGDKIEVFPVTPERFAQRHGGADGLRFLCDVHLWKLARWLRLLGFDTAFDKKWRDPELADISHNEKRILLSRDRGLLMRNKVESGLLVRNTDPHQQLLEILERLGIGEFIRPFSRCMVCNGILEPADMEGEFFKERLWPQIPEGVRRWCKEYRYCQTCNKVFWKGSHYKNMIKTLPVGISYRPGSF